MVSTDVFQRVVETELDALPDVDRDHPRAA